MGDCRLCSLVFVCHDHSAQILEFPGWLVPIVLPTALGRRNTRPKQAPRQFIGCCARQKSASADHASDELLPKNSYKPVRD